MRPKRPDQKSKRREISRGAGLALGLTVAVSLLAWRFVPARGKAGFASRPPPSPEERMSPGRLARLRARPWPVFRLAPGAGSRDGGGEASRTRAVQLLQELLDPLRASPHFGQGTPEFAAVAFRGQIAEWAGRIASDEPQLIPEIAREIERRLCDGVPADEELLVFGYIGLHLPDSTTAHGFECLFKSHPGEDVVIWTMLDAWRHSDRGVTPAIAQLARDAKDPRTKRRFMTAEEERQLRELPH